MLWCSGWGGGVKSTGAGGLVEGISQVTGEFSESAYKGVKHFDK